MSVNWILARLITDAAAEVEINHLYDSYKFEYFDSGKKDAVLSKNSFIDHLKCLFPHIEKIRRRSVNSHQTVYKGVSVKELSAHNGDTIEFSQIKDHMPSSVTLKSSCHQRVVFQHDSGCLCNGNCVLKVLTFHIDGTFDISIAGKAIDLTRLNIDASFQLTQCSVSCVFAVLNFIKLCNGLKFDTSLTVSRFHTLETWTSDGETYRSLRSLSCFKAVAFNSKTLTCRVCQQQFLFQQNKENIKSDTNTQQSTETLEQTINRVFPNAPQPMINMLIEQAKNLNQHPNGRRWSKEYISTCIQLYNRSPKSYERLAASGMILMPSKSVLILYKNAIKQEPGFDSSVFEWMNAEANRLEIEDCARIGGIIFDEMSIQEDIQIGKNGSVLELSGFTDLGQEGDMCQHLRKGSTNKVMGTHVLQLLFLGLNGFRFPFAHFVTDSVLSSQLYALFWKAVYLLFTFGFKVIFTCMDGAQCNRSFMHACLGNNPTKFISPSPCTSNPVIFIMDISHVIKKIRNNAMKSGLNVNCKRILTLPNSMQIHWQMFVDFFMWDQQNALQIHRKLTNEHIYPDNQLKMRNYLAEDMLNLTMLNSMKTYQECLGEKGQVLNGIIEFLEQTSQLVQIFRDSRPVRDMNDSRLLQLKKVNDWFTNWEENMENKYKQKHIMSYQCHEDIHSCILGFIDLCETALKMKTPVLITPSLINSDVIENIFNQQRSTYNGANTNPTALQYNKTINSILIGQNSISKKANAARSSTPLPFPVAVGKPCKKRKAEQRSSTKQSNVIKVLHI